MCWFAVLVVAVILIIATLILEPDDQQIRALALDLKGCMKRLRHIRKRHESEELKQAEINLEICRLFLRKHGHGNWFDT